MKYVAKYQRAGTDRYISEETDTLKSFTALVVDIAQTRGKGWKYRLMEFDDSDPTVIVARFDVQFTKQS